jgi:hypothetical protein
MLLVQEFLQTRSFGDLAKEHGVYASFSKSGHKFSLNYDQIEARESDPLSQQCRGLILASPDGTPIPGSISNDGRVNRDAVIPGPTVVVARSMDRFFNHGQGSCAPINWSDPNLSILEKLDGTLCIVYWDPFTQQWCVATRSVPEADLLMDNGIFTFRTLFEKALLETSGKSFEEFTYGLGKNYTWCFELTTPYNRIVVNYPNCRITLLAARSLSTMSEIDVHELSFYLTDIPIVQAHAYTSVEELLNWISSLNPLEHEGVVVRDSNFNRIKMKNAAYVAYNKLHDRLGTSERNCLEIVLLEKDDDVMAFMPEEIVNNIKRIKTGLQSVIKQYDELYQQAVEKVNQTNPGDKKTFALLVSQDKNMWSAPFFHMFGGKSNSMKDFILKSRKDGTWGDSFLDRILDLIKIVKD